ncbi:hypothetical protein SAMN05216203_1553 [Marinobacter daqiaonensis]|uniref:Uncharacterized protein n=1 Tax=Marinobacter daqiaonensis TaxID=650891 RepID=A0A1I6HUC1_9GAMM|nr:hypothetical protein [Marinobacter daqiaonensis]SFR57997.1 hypothetical protein SAMN05216203_1553 [Marinobacter daqiaonensis]
MISARSSLPGLVALAALLVLTSGCATTSTDDARPETFAFENLGQTIVLPVDLLRGSTVMQETGVAILTPDGRSVTLDTRTHDDFAEPVPLPRYPLYVMALEEPSTEDGLTETTVEDLLQAREIVMYGEQEPKKVTRFDTRHGKGYAAITDGEAFIYLVTDGYDAGITEVYLWGFTANEVETWIAQGRIR